MFYVEVDDNKNIIIVQEPTARSIEIDDDIENYYHYIYDIYTQKIVKRNVIDYELTPVENDLLITFNTETFLQVNIEFNGQIEGYGNVGRILFLESEDGKVEVKVSSLLSGIIYISSGDSNVFFEPLSIESETAIDNEYNPVIYVEGNEVRIATSVDYNRFRSLQRDIELLQEEIKELRLVVSS